MWEFYQKNPQALAEIRAPLFEEKVVDHILSQVKVDETTVSREALFAEDEEESSSPTASAQPEAAAADEGKPEQA